MRIHPAIRIAGLFAAGVLLLNSYSATPREKRLAWVAMDRANEVEQGRISGLDEGNGTNRFMAFDRAVEEVRKGAITQRDKIVFDSLVKYQLDMRFQTKAYGLHANDRALLEQMIGPQPNRD